MNRYCADPLCGKPNTRRFGSLWCSKTCAARVYARTYRAKQAKIATLAASKGERRRE